MKQGRRTRPARRWLLPVLVGVAIVALAGAYLVSRDTVPERSYTRAGDFQDIHGLAVDPRDHIRLYIATHDGLILGNETGWWRIGGSRDDLMGFTMHPRNADVFWASGHGRQGNLGVRQSTDGGFTWTTLGLEGADVHALTVSSADPDVLWAVWQGELHHSTDAGRTWDVVNASPPAISALAGHPTLAGRLYAAGPEGVFVSEDSGATFTTVRPGPHTAVAVSPVRPTLVMAATPTGVAKSVDAGATWQDLAGPQGARVTHVAFDAQDEQAVLVATADAAIFESTDGGVVWDPVKAPG